MLRAILSLPRIRIFTNAPTQARLKISVGIRLGRATEQARPYIRWQQPLRADRLGVYRTLIGITITWQFSCPVAPGAVICYQARPAASQRRGPHDRADRPRPLLPRRHA